MSIDKMRRAYERSGLNETDMDPDPLVQFERWFETARQPDLPEWIEINAMTLSTSDPNGEVTSRIVLLKGIENGRLSFFTNYESEKGLQLAANPRASLCFFWPHLERQVRIRGSVSKTDRQQSEDYFHSRPRESQLGAHVSRQSEVLASRDVLEQQVSELERQYEGQPIPCPDYWGGYEVTPVQFEFWQGRLGRLHDRLCYRQTPGSSDWTIVRLSP